MKLQVNRFGTLQAVTPITKRLIDGIKADDSLTEFLLESILPVDYKNNLCQEFGFTSMQNTWKL